MATIYCKSHPSVPARWTCPQCDVDLCSGCVKAGKNFTLCPVCKSPMAPLGMGNVITPFWLRIPKFFLYPARPVALIYIAVLALLSAFFGASGLFSALMQLVIFVVFVRYGYAALESSAQGHLDPPAVSSELVSGDLSLPFKQLAIFILMFASVGVAASLLGRFGAVVMLILVYLSLPASVMELATSHSFGAAINPANLFGTMRCIGWPYLVLWFFLVMLTASSAAVQYLLPGMEHSFWARLLYDMANMYFLLAMFHLMGYVIYQYHQILNYAVAVDFDETSESNVAKVEKPADPVNAQVALLLQEGKADAARQLLVEKIASAPGSLELRGKLHKLLVLAGDAQGLAESAQPFITLLMAEQKTRQAAEILRDCQRLVPEFRPANPDYTYPLMQQLRALREPQLAVKLAQNFHQRHDNHVELPNIYFLVAQIMCEELKQDQQAAKILGFLQSKFPQHELAPKIREYLALLGWLATAG
ncbi:MAG: hypothetical protein ABFE02_07770 [Sulfuricella sp.]